MDSRLLDPTDEDDEERIEEICEEHDLELGDDDSVWIMGRSWNGHGRGSIVVTLPDDTEHCCMVL